jgi:hypothetical protein
MSGPQKFRKPVVIEAWQYLCDCDGGKGNGPLVAEWCSGEVVGHPNPPAYVIEIDTLEGTMYTSHGDWVIRGVQGEFYPCKPDIFAATYEAVPS